MYVSAIIRGPSQNCISGIAEAPMALSKYF